MLAAEFCSFKEAVIWMRQTMKTSVLFVEGIKQQLGPADCSTLQLLSAKNFLLQGKEAVPCLFVCLLLPT